MPNHEFDDDHPRHVYIGGHPFLIHLPEIKRDGHCFNSDHVLDVNMLFISHNYFILMNLEHVLDIVCQLESDLR